MPGWADAQAAQFGRQDATRAHQLARQCLSANAFDPGSQKHPAVSLESGSLASQPAATMDHRILRSPRLSQDPGRDRQQARAHRVGDPCQGRALRRFCLAATSHGAGVARRELVTQQRFAAERDSKTRSDRPREQPGYSAGGYSPCLADHRRGAAPIFNWGSLVRLLSWPAQTITAQQGRLQRRSLFLDLGRIQQRDQENGLKPPLWPP